MCIVFDSSSVLYLPPSLSICIVFISLSVLSFPHFQLSPFSFFLSFFLSLSLSLSLAIYPFRSLSLCLSLSSNFSFPLSLSLSLSLSLKSAILLVFCRSSGGKLALFLLNFCSINWSFIWLDDDGGFQWKTFRQKL